MCDCKVVTRGTEAIRNIAVATVILRERSDRGNLIQWQRPEIATGLKALAMTFSDNDKNAETSLLAVVSASLHLFSL